MLDSLMEKIRLGLFDVFSFVLPGLLIIHSYVILVICEYSIVDEIVIISKEISIIQVFLILIMSYYIGVLVQYLSFELFEFIALRIWKNRLKSKSLSISRYESDLAKIRHYSPANYDLLERWMALRGMCYNSFFAFLVLLICSLVKISISPEIKFIDFGIELFLILGLMVLSIRRAVTFHEWSISTIQSTRDLLDRDVK